MPAPIADIYTSDAAWDLTPDISPLPREPATDIRPFELDRNSHSAQLSLMPVYRITHPEFRRIMLCAAATGASDVTLQTEAQPRIEVNGVLYRLRGRPWTGSEIDRILEHTYGAASGPAEIKARRSLDYSYEILLEDSSRRRFRVNATGIRCRDGSGIELTFRILPDDPPDCASVGLQAEEITAMTPENGLVIIAGATGSGKSSTMAALTRHHLERTDRQVKIVDIQAPIEYVFRRTTSRRTGSASVIGQSEIGRHLPDFASGVRSALRRKPHIINVGEARDRETIAAALEAALTGHLVYTTTHAGSVQDCVRRLLAAFPATEREHRAGDIGTSLRFVMTQRLIPSVDGQRRVALREWMSFGSGAGEAMLGIPAADWPGFILDCMAGRGDGGCFRSCTRSLADSAALLVRQGLFDTRSMQEYLSGHRLPH
ncbi:MAG: ATPase, T2SS/T4P/T4SS family [Rhodobacteraceae bacterium]|nr:ATPase, T2SS/T4P/T4SS family [Paracoccaceae bacterium]